MSVSPARAGRPLMNVLVFGFIMLGDLILLDFKFRELGHLRPRLPEGDGAEAAAIMRSFVFVMI
jgi:hypothetical protein